jgi:AraC-like DNA-binding protein
MTRRANALTRPAKPTAGSGATVPVGSLRVFADAAARVGIDVAALLDGSWFAASDLSDPDAVIPAAACRGFFEGLQRRPIPNLALRLALETPLGSYPLLDYLVLSSRTVGEALQRLARHARLATTAVAFELETRASDVRLVYHASDDFFVQYSAALTVRHLRDEAAGPLAVEYIALQAPMGPLDEWQARLGSPARLEAWTGVVFSHDACALPMRRADALLQSVLEQHARQVEARRAEPDVGDLRVRRAIESGLATGEVTVTSVARSLALSTRTLQRRLAVEGTSFRGLLEDVRRVAAARHLSALRLSNAEVAYLLGFSELAAFQRAFRRWYGVTPGEFRRTARGA